MVWDATEILKPPVENQLNAFKLEYFIYLYIKYTTRSIY